jgi:hypothetical protein
MKQEPGETGGGVVGRWQAKSSKRPTYRIITKGHPYYEVAYDFDLDQIKLRVCYLVIMLRYLISHCLIILFLHSPLHSLDTIHSYSICYLHE